MGEWESMYRVLVANMREGDCSWPRFSWYDNINITANKWLLEGCGWRNGLRYGG